MTESADRLGNVPSFDTDKEKISTNEKGELYIFHEGNPSIKITQEIAKRISEFQKDYPYSHHHQQITPIDAWGKLRQQDLQDELEDRSR